MAEIIFAEKVYAICRKIPKGKVTTYKEIAKVLGIKGYQAVGHALACNPYAPIVPCHRVISSDGSLGGFKGKRSGLELDEKKTLLSKEGVIIKEDKVDLSLFLFRFS